MFFQKGLIFTDKKKLYILTYDHGGYVLWKDSVKPRITELFEWMEKYPKLRVGLDYESFTFDEFSECDPEVMELIRKLIEKYPDRVGLGATTYGQPLSLTISDESNVRQLTYAVRTNMKYFGKTPDVYAISEFALNNQTPQLIKKCGYKAAVMRSHVMGYGYVRTFDSAWGNWVGKDNTSIPAVPTYDKQGRGFNCTTVDNWILSRWPQDTDISLEDFEKMFEKYSPLLASRYDDLMQEVKGVTEHIEKKDNYEYILLEDIPALYGEATDELKTYDNDFSIQMPWGYCGNEIFNGVRKAEISAVQSEMLDALSFAANGKSMTSELEKAWKYALAAQHHDVTICGLLDLSRRFVPASLENSDKVRSNSLSAIKNLFGGNGKTDIAVNTHSFPVDEWVKTDDGRYIHVNLPAFSAGTAYKNVNTYDYIWNEAGNELSTPLYVIKFSEKGIVSIDIKSTGRRILENADSPLFTAYIDEENCTSEGRWTVTTDSSGATAVFTGSIGSVPFSVEMRFNGNSPRIDCRTQFEIHNQKIGRTDEKMGLGKPLTICGHRHEDKLNMHLDLCLDKNRRMIRDLPYSIADWSGAVRVTEDYWYELDKILIDKVVSPEESFNSSTQFSGIYHVAMRDKNQGLAVMNRGCMGAFVRGNQLSVPLVYANEYMCGTKMLDGIFDDEFALMPFDSDISDTDIFRNAFLYNAQPVVSQAECDNTETVKFADFINESGKVILTSFYQENGSILARFCNYSDNKQTAVLTPAKGSVTAETDLLGNDTKPIENGTLFFRPWEIKTVRISL